MRTLVNTIMERVCDPEERNPIRGSWILSRVNPGFPVYASGCFAGRPPVLGARPSLHPYESHLKSSCG